MTLQYMPPHCHLHRDAGGQLRGKLGVDRRGEAFPQVLENIQWDTADRGDD